MLKLNCWEFKQCGRQPMGEKIDELGVCPVTLETRVNGINDGKNGGRACWAVSRSQIGDKGQGSYVSKLNGCLNCDFFNEVRQQQGEKFVKSGAILNLLKS